MKTIDDICKQPKGSFQAFVNCTRELQRTIEENRKARIRARREGKPLPELPFEVELWMLA